MRRVRNAKVLVSEKKVGFIQNGLLIYLGVHSDDQNEDLSWIIKKILGLRIFEDGEGRMNRPINSEQGILLISQFTLLEIFAKGTVHLLIRRLTRLQVKGYMNKGLLK